MIVERFMKAQAAHSRIKRLKCAIEQMSGYGILDIQALGAQSNWDGCISDTATNAMVELALEDMREQLKGLQIEFDAL